MPSRSWCLSRTSDHTAYTSGLYGGLMRQRYTSSTYDPQHTSDDVPPDPSRKSHGHICTCHANGRLLNNTDVLFASNAESFEAVKKGITFDNDVKKRNLRTAIKPKDRPKVLKKHNLDDGLNRDVRIVMRSGHVLRGVMLIHSRYNLVLKINQALVLVYRHGVLEFAITTQQKPQTTRD